jgi:triosephosphate isomerase
MGAYTGEMSADQVADLGVKYALVGHSERRTLYKETDNEAAMKVAAGLKKGLKIILCIGETLAQREAGETDEVTARQLAAVNNLLSK